MPMGRGLGIVLGLALSMGCKAKVHRAPQPSPPPAEVSPPRVEPRDGEPILDDEWEDDATESEEPTLSTDR